VYRRFAFFILPYTRLELPGWRYLLHALKVAGRSNDPLWKGAPTKTIRNKWNGYLITLDLSNWSERYTYFLGRYHAVQLQLAMSEVLEPGDRFVDIGSNIGMISLHGAALVTDSGRIDSVEPNPDCCKRILDVLKLNTIEHVHLHRVGLSDQEGSLTLRVISHDAGLGTFALPRADEKGLISNTFEVPVVTGDSVIMESSTPVKLVKIDVEGFELRVLRGLSETLGTWLPIVVAEVSTDWLSRAGTSRTELSQFMGGFGYSAYGLAAERRGSRYQLALEPISDKDVEGARFADFLWVHAESLGYGALEPFIRKRVVERVSRGTA